MKFYLKLCQVKCKGPGDTWWSCNPAGAGWFAFGCFGTNPITV